MGKTDYEEVKGGLDSEQCRIITELEDITMEIESTQGSIWETESTQGSTCEAPSAITMAQLRLKKEDLRLNKKNWLLKKRKVSNPEMHQQ